MGSLTFLNSNGVSPFVRIAFGPHNRVVKMMRSGDRESSDATTRQTTLPNLCLSRLCGLAVARAEVARCDGIDEAAVQHA